MKRKMRYVFEVSEKNLETERMILRPWKNSDLHDLYAYASVIGVGEMAGWKHHKNLKDSRAVLFNFMVNKNVYAIELKSSQKVIGSIGVEKIYNNYLGYQYKNLSGRELGFVLNKDYWGQGLVAEAVAKVVEHLFESFKFDYLLCAHFKNNNQSKRVIEKLGFNYVKEISFPTLFNLQERALIYVKDNPNLVY